MGRTRTLVRLSALPPRRRRPSLHFHCPPRRCFGNRHEWLQFLSRRSGALSLFASPLSNGRLGTHGRSPFIIQHSTVPILRCAMRRAGRRGGQSQRRPVREPRRRAAACCCRPTIRKNGRVTISAICTRALPWPLPHPHGCGRLLWWCLGHRHLHSPDSFINQSSKAQADQGACIIVTPPPPPHWRPFSFSSSQPAVVRSRPTPKRGGPSPPHRGGVFGNASHRTLPLVASPVFTFSCMGAPLAGS